MILFAASLIVLFLLLENSESLKINKLVLLMGLNLIVLLTSLWVGPVFPIGTRLLESYLKGFSINYMTGLYSLVVTISLVTLGVKYKKINKNSFLKIIIVQLLLMAGLSFNNFYLFFLGLLVVEAYLAISYKLSLFGFGLGLLISLFLSLGYFDIHPEVLFVLFVVMSLVSISRLNRSLAFVVFPSYLLLINAVFQKSQINFANDFQLVILCFFLMVFSVSLFAKVALGVSYFVSAITTIVYGVNVGLLVYAACFVFLDYKDIEKRNLNVVELFAYALPVLVLAGSYLVLPREGLLISLWVDPNISFLKIFITLFNVMLASSALFTVAKTIFGKISQAETPITFTKKTFISFVLSAVVCVIPVCANLDFFKSFELKDVLIAFMFLIIVFIVSLIKFKTPLIDEINLFSKSFLKLRIKVSDAFILFLKAALEFTEVVVGGLVKLITFILEGSFLVSKNSFFILADVAEYFEPKKFQHEAFWFLLLLASSWFYVWSIV